MERRHHRLPVRVRAADGSRKAAPRIGRLDRRVRAERDERSGRVRGRAAERRWRSARPRPASRSTYRCRGGTAGPTPRRRAARTGARPPGRSAARARYGDWARPAAAALPARRAPSGRRRHRWRGSGRQSPAHWHGSPSAELLRYDRRSMPLGPPTGGPAGSSGSYRREQRCAPRSEGAVREELQPSVPVAAGWCGRGPVPSAACPARFASPTRSPARAGAPGWTRPPAAAARRARRGRGRATARGSTPRHPPVARVMHAGDAKRRERGRIRR